MLPMLSNELIVCLFLISITASKVQFKSLEKYEKFICSDYLNSFKLYFLYK